MFELAYDTDGDGYTDQVFADLDGDGDYEVSYTDLDHDGDFDAAAFDLDGNGSYDSLGLDLDGDGLFDDAGVVDVDHDGVPEAQIGAVPGLIVSADPVDVGLNDLLTSQLFSIEGVDHTFGGV